MTETKNQNLREHKYYVEGMHCASCEILIEKKLLKQPGVSLVNASLNNAEVRVFTEVHAKIDLDAINQDIKQFGYALKTSPVRNEHLKLFSKAPNGNWRVNKTKLKQLVRNLVVAFGLLIVFFVVERMQLGKYASIDDTSTYSAFFLLGIVAGVSSCAALVGGLLLSLIKHWNEVYIDSEKSSQKATPHILFHVGRMSSFFILGGLLGVVGDAITFDNASTYSFLAIGISILMVVMALQMLNVGWARKLTPRLPKFITRVAANEQSFQGKFMPLITGALTFFLPCGFTLIAQGVALATGSFISGALVMTFFAVGTLPMLLAISLTGLKFTSKPHLTAKFSYIAGVVIIFFALYNVNGQFNVLGLPSLSDVSFAKKVDTSNEKVKAATYEAGEEQVISLVAKGFSYIPTGATTFKAGMPTKLVVDNQGVQGCGSFMASRGLIDGFVPLNKGQNVIDLGSPKAGTYKITCSMGMVPPVTIIIN